MNRKDRKQLLDYDIHDRDILRHHNPADGSPNDYLVYYGPERIMFLTPRNQAAAAKQHIHIPGQPRPDQAPRKALEELIMVAVGWWWQPINFTNPGYEKHFFGNMAFQVKYLQDARIDMKVVGDTGSIPEGYTDEIRSNLTRIVGRLLPLSTEPAAPQEEDQETVEDGPPPGVIVV
jgi:hypothetical protein